MSPIHPMKKPNQIICLLGLLLVPSCAFSPSKASVPTPTAGWESGIGRPGAVLYGRDGSPVGTGATRMPTGPAVEAAQNPQAQPMVSATDAMPHRPTETVGSRPALLEMYQEVISEKEQLQMQVFELQQALHSSEDRILELDQRMQVEIEGRVLAEQTSTNSQAQAVEMGRRLAVAQMRRLEAEKMLLEKTLAERRKLAELSQ